jgi:DinB family protein
MADSVSTVAAVLELLDVERTALLARVARVPDERRTRRPAPDRWSVAEVLEHLARVEGGVTKLLVSRGRDRPAEALQTAPDTRLTVARIAQLRSRAERFQAPERIQPSGALGATEALRKLAETRDALCEAFRAADPAALDGQTHTHPILGTLTLRGWVEFLAHHEARHGDQIEEIADALATRSR